MDDSYPASFLLLSGVEIFENAVSIDCVEFRAIFSTKFLHQKISWNYGHFYSK